MMDLRERMQEESGDWYVAGIARRGDELLVIETERVLTTGAGKELPPRTQLKFPGGTRKVAEDRNDRTPLDTLQAEFSEEVFWEDGNILSWNPLHYEKKGNHEKFFSIVEIEGELREVSIEEEPSKDEYGFLHEETLSPPQWMRVDRLAGAIYPSHGPALAALCEELAGESENFLWALNELQRRGIS